MGSRVDLYRILQVEPTADSTTIRASYRRLARERHPDVGGSDEQMALLNRAWRVLRSPDERAVYDARIESNLAVGRPPRPDEQTTPPATPSSTPSSASPGPQGGSTVLTFGRYAGWSLAQLAVHDPDYLEWLARTPVGRGYQHEIQSLLIPRPTATATLTASPGRRRSIHGRR